MSRVHRLWFMFIANLAFATPVLSEELGPLETFDRERRKVGIARFTDTTDEYSLLSSQAYRAGESAGFRGELSIKKTYTAGGFEVLLREYWALCESTQGRAPSVRVVEIGSDKRGETVEITITGKQRTEQEKVFFSIHRTLCKGHQHSKSARKPTFEESVECCDRHWISKQGGGVAPEGRSTRTYKSRSDLQLTCQLGIPQNAWAGYLEMLGRKDFC